MEGHCGTAAGRGYRWLGAGEERLDRALVAGLMLDAALSASAWPPDPQDQGRALKIRVQEALLSHLAGRITLDGFHGLINTLERSFSFYFPLISSLLAPPAQSPVSPPNAASAGGDASAGYRAVHGDLLASGLDGLQGILPRRPGSKLTGSKLHDILSRTGGAWFRLRDFQEHFAVDRKTAWEYVQKFLQAGLLVHNQGRAAAVRYGLADGFLKVRAGALRREVAALFPDLSSPLAARVADRLIASGGEPFWEEEWRRLLPAAALPAVIQGLTKPGSLLEVVSAGDLNHRLLRLKEPWLQGPEPSS